MSQIGFAQRFRLYETLGKRLVTTLIIISILLISGLGYLYNTSIGVTERRLVGIIRVEGPIISTSDADSITASINSAIFNSSVKAVVLRIDSPGGYADLVEQIYLDVLELRKQKPVVASVVQALSGGYYVAVAADYIYAHPSSMVGNIGVIGVGPQTLIPSEFTMETGPNKVTGFSKLLFPFNLSHCLDSFASAVEDGRGNRLKLSPTELRRGSIYMGSEALSAGLADEIGSLQSALKRAAKEANITSYEVVYFSPIREVSTQTSTGSNQTGVEFKDITIGALNRINPPPAIYYLYMPSNTLVQKAITQWSSKEGYGSSTTSWNASMGIVVVDLSHGNLVSSWELDIVAAELAKKNLVLSFVDAWKDVDSTLTNASALIVAVPTKSYTSDECDRIGKFVADGRIVLLFYDPAEEYQEIPVLMGPMNSLANRFGLSFAKGYLYNEEDHYGLYRNIYVRKFANTSLTRKLNTIILFTATHIRSNGKEAGWTSNDTYSSTSERNGSYAPLAVVEGNGTVAAFGDLTFLMEPYCYLEDNFQLILNTVSAIAEVKR